VQNKSVLDTKEAFGYKVQQEAKQICIFFLICFPPPALDIAHEKALWNDIINKKCLRFLSIE
jgi:hypothetical protein